MRLDRHRRVDHRRCRGWAINEEYWPMVRSLFRSLVEVLPWARERCFESCCIDRRLCFLEVERPYLPLDVPCPGTVQVATEPPLSRGNPPTPSPGRCKKAEISSTQTTQPFQPDRGGWCSGVKSFLVECPNRNSVNRTSSTRCQTRLWLKSQSSTL